MGAQILAIFNLEWVRELRNRNALSAVVMYVVVTLFIVLQSFHGFTDFKIYNALFWIILVFASMQSTEQIGNKENKGHRLYLYTLAHPVAVILGKILFNTVFTLVVGLITFLGYILFFGMNPLEGIHWGSYAAVLILGIIGFASIFTMVSAITVSANQNAGLKAVLGFPLILPLVVSMINVSIAASKGSGWDITLMPILSIFAIIVINISLSFLLFPYLWRE